MKMRKITIKDFDYIVSNLPVEIAKICLRKIRENECFSIVNRGNVWYNLLTDTQKTELKEWYQSWLNVTETLVCPCKPDWLK